MLDIWLAVLKFAAILVAGALGIFSLGVEYRDSAGRITKWGRRALLATITATMIGAITVAFETYKQQQDLTEQNARTLALLGEVRRGIYPLRDVNFSGRLILPLDTEDLTGYRRRLQAEVEQVLTLSAADMWERHRAREILLGATRSQPIKRVGVVFSADSNLYPRVDEGDVREALDNLGLLVQFFRTMPHIAPMGIAARADLQYFVEIDCVELSYHVGRPELEILFEAKDTQLEKSRGSDLIVSVVDLKDAVVLVEAHSSDIHDAIGLNATAAVFERADVATLEMSIDDRVFEIAHFTKKFPGISGSTFTTAP